MNKKGFGYLAGAFLLGLFFCQPLFTGETGPGWEHRDVNTPPAAGQPMTDNPDLARIIDLVKTAQSQQVEILFENPSSIFNGVPYHFVNTS